MRKKTISIILITLILVMSLGSSVNADGLHKQWNVEDDLILGNWNYTNDWQLAKPVLSVYGYYEVDSSTDKFGYSVAHPIGVSTHRSDSNYTYITTAQNVEIEIRTASGYNFPSLRRRIDINETYTQSSTTNGLGHAILNAISSGLSILTNGWSGLIPLGLGSSSSGISISSPSGYSRTVDFGTKRSAGLDTDILVYGPSSGVHRMYINATGDIRVTRIPIFNYMKLIEKYEGDETKFLQAFEDDKRLQEEIFKIEEKSTSLVKETSEYQSLASHGVIDSYDLEVPVYVLVRN